MSPHPSCDPAGDAARDLGSWVFLLWADSPRCGLGGIYPPGASSKGSNLLCSSSRRSSASAINSLSPSSTLGFARNARSCATELSNLAARLLRLPNPSAAPPATTGHRLASEQRRRRRSRHMQNICHLSVGRAALV